MADADYEWLDDNLPEVTARLTLSGQREVLRVVESVQADAWETGARAYADWNPQTHKRPDNPYRSGLIRGSSERDA